MGTPPLNIKREGRWKGDITILSDSSNNNRADSSPNLKWLTEFKPIHDTPSFRPSCSPISKAFISLVQDYRNSFKLPIDIPIGPHQTSKYSGVYSVYLTKRKKILLKLWGSHPLQF